jgi:hypothetical protein
MVATPARALPGGFGTNDPSHGGLHLRTFMVSI